VQQQKYYPLKIIGIIEETSAAKTFVLQPLDGWKPTYRPGQFLTLVFQTKHGEKRRSYSLSSAPALQEALAITIKKVENGEFSRLLLSHAAAGDVLYSSGISGLFTLPGAGTVAEQFFFLAAGSGITPCFSMITTLLYTTRKKVVLVYSNKTESETIFYARLQQLETEFPERFVIRFLFSYKADVYQSRLSNWLLQQLLLQLLTVSHKHALFYLCGPFEYMQMITITLLSEGFKEYQIRKENFYTHPRLLQPVPPDTEAHAVQIYFNKQEYSIIAQYPQTILAAAKQNGIALPYSCEAGRCGSCAATCISGSCWMAYNEVLLDEDVAKGRILCCQAYAVQTNVTIVIDE